MTTLMRRFLRWTAGGLLVLLALLLLVAGAWALSQRPDAAPQPRPAALVLPDSGPPGRSFERVQALLEPEAGVPVRSFSEPPLNCPPTEDCAARWAADTDGIARQLAAQPVLVARCEAAVAAQASEPFEEWLPPNIGPSTPLASFAGAVQCLRVFGGQAVVAAARGDRGAALAGLQHSRDWALGQLQGARTLIGHMIGYAGLHLHLHAVEAVARQQPAWGSALLPLAAAWPEALLRPDRWMPSEATVVRGAVDETDAHCRAEPADEAARAAVESEAAALMPMASGGLSLWLCRHRLGWLPEQTRQSLDAVWLARLERASQGYGTWLETARAQREGGASAESGGLPWRNTLGAMLVLVAQGDTMYDAYVARAADAELHRQALVLALAAVNAGVAPAERAAWLTAQTGIDARSRERLAWSDDGLVLVVQPWAALVERSGPRVRPRRIVLAGSSAPAR